jgi:nicotinamidase/pyrazinamidase
VDGTDGFAFAPELPVNAGALIIDKGTRVDRDAYSGFDGTALAHELRIRRIRRCVVAGLATDYCVKATVLDALREGFETWLLTDAIAAVNVHPGDEARAVLEMRSAGAMLSDSGQIVNILRSHPEPTAFIVVDVQKDFCTGSLAVPNASRIFGPIRELLERGAP